MKDKHTNIYIQAHNYTVALLLKKKSERLGHLELKLKMIFLKVGEKDEFNASFRISLTSHFHRKKRSQVL